MKKLLLVCMAIGFSQVVLADNHSSATDEVIALVEKNWEARNNNDYRTQLELRTEGTHYNANSSGTFLYSDEKPSLEEISEDLAGEYDVTVMYPNAVSLSDTVVLARYYLEGSMSADDVTVSNYRTRVTHIWVKEDGEWKSKSWHFSPLHNGGTTPN